MYVARWSLVLLAAGLMIGAAPAPAVAQIGALRKKAEEAKKKVEEAAAKKAVVDSAKAKPAADTARPNTGGAAAPETAQPS